MRKYDPKLKPYNKKLEHSYAFGVYPTLDLIMHKSDRVLKVILREDDSRNEGVKRIIKECEERDLKIEHSDRIIDKLSSKENTYAIGVFQKYKTNLRNDANHIVLDQPRNMGNIGTIIRTMVGFNIHDIALIKPAADIFDPKVIRSAMGALFSANFKYFESIDKYMNEYPTHSYYPFMLKNSRDIRQIAIDLPYSLIFGSEANGLGEEYSEVGRSVNIPQTNEIDSLNLSIAASIAMWHFASTRGDLSGH